MTARTTMTSGAQTTMPEQGWESLRVALGRGDRLVATVPAGTDIHLYKRQWRPSTPLSNPLPAPYVLRFSQTGAAGFWGDELAAWTPAGLIDKMCALWQMEPTQFRVIAQGAGTDTLDEQGERAQAIRKWLLDHTVDFCNKGGGRVELDGSDGLIAVAVTVLGKEMGFGYGSPEAAFIAHLASIAAAAYNKGYEQTHGRGRHAKKVDA